MHVPGGRAEVGLLDLRRQQLSMLGGCSLPGRAIARARFPDAGDEVIDALVAELHREFDGDPIRDFVPVLVERQAVDHLAASSHHQRRPARV